MKSAEGSSRQLEVLNIFNSHFINTKILKRMRKHFLLLFLLTLLPLSGWAVSFLDETVTVSANDAAFNTAIATIKGGITVKINNETLDAANWNWDGKFYATATAAADEDATGLVAVATGSTTPGVNTYYIRIVPTTAANSDYKVIPLIIRKADILASDVTAPVGYTGDDALTYINKSTAQKLIKTAGSCTWGTLQYRLGTTGSWVTNKDDITAINAATYTIYYKVVADANHNDYGGAVSITSKISQKPLPTVTAAAFVMNKDASYTYKAAVQAPTFTVTDGDDDISADIEVTWYTDASLTSEVGGDGPKDARTGADYYYAKLTATATGNYTGNAGYAADDAVKSTWKFQIAKKSAIIYVENKSMVYSGNKIAMNDDGTQITGAKVTANGVYEANIKASFAAKFTTESLNGKTEGVLNAPSKAGSYAMTAFQVTPLAGVDDITKNYTPTYMAVGSYTIERRKVTVSAKDQTFTYTGSEQALTTTVSGETVTYDEATATNEVGFITTETAATALFPYITISKKGTYTIKETVNEAYTGGIVISEAEDAVNSNYEIIAGNAGNVIVNGKALVMIAGSFEKQYGYPVDFTKDFTVLTDDPNVVFDEDSDPQPTYTVTSQADPTKTYTTGDVLPLGKYTIAISNVAAITPANYTVTEATLYTGEIEITKKDLEITINSVGLNTGDGIDELTKYGTVDESYKNELVTIGGKKDVVAFTLKFAEGLALTAENKLKAATDYTIVDDAIANAVDGKLTASTEAAPNNNANYNITFVKGSIVLGGAKTLKLDMAETRLADKIADAATACAADESVKYDVTFAARTLEKDVWYTMVLPFATTPKAVVAAFDEYVVVNRMSDKSNKDHISFLLEMTEIPAGEPFLVKVANDVTLGTGVIGKFASQKISADAKTISGQGATKFIATYTAKTIQNCDTEDNFRYGWLNYENFGDPIPGHPELNWENRWYGAASSHDVLPCEAYLIYQNNYTPAAREFDFENEPLITVQDADGSTTAISMVKAGEFKAINNDGWYTLNGVKLNAAPTEKGIYINNGKKIVIK